MRRFVFIFCFLLVDTGPVAASTLAESYPIFHASRDAEKGKPASERFKKLKGIIEKSANSGDTTFNRIALVAAEGYAPAIRYVARRFLLGQDGARQDRGKAYYWIKRAETEGEDISDIVEDPDELLNRMTTQEKKHLLWTVNAFGELKSTDRRISFHSLRQRIFTKKECNEILDFTSMRIPQFMDAFRKTNDAYDIRIPMAYAAEMMPCIDVLIDVARGWDWESENADRDIFMDELNRTRALLHGVMDDVFEAAELHRQRDNDELDKRLAFWLNQWAAVKGHTAAEYVEVEKNFADPISLRTGIRLQRLANRNYIPAMEDAVRRFYHGESVRRDRGVALYWLRRLKTAQGEPSNVLDISPNRLMKQLSAEERDSYEKAKRFFAMLNH